MVKEIIEKIGRTYGEYCVLPRYTPSDCTLQDVTLETKLSDDLTLKIPLLSAAMTSVTGYEMALALGKEGGLGVLPVRLSIEEQVDIIKKIKMYEMGFVEDPIKVRENMAIEDVIREIEKYGHSTIPITDMNNLFLGMFVEENYLQSNANPTDNVTEAMIPFESENILYSPNPKISVDEAKKLLEKNNKRYFVVLDDQKRLVKLAFRKDIEKIKVGAAVSTHKGWEKRVEAIVEAGVDLIVIDTSDAYNEFTIDVIKKYKERYQGDRKIKVPICAGNVVTYEGGYFLMENGADIIRVGMSSGSICSTQREKAVGRAPMTALIEIGRARKDYYEKTKRYIPTIIDGGICTSADMVIALSIADAIMGGYYFNRFDEAAADKLDEGGTRTTDRNKMAWVEIWGEGSKRAQNFDRYGHTSKKTFFEEGVEGKVPYEGRLKPYLKKDLMKIKSALSNVGCKTLEEFRENVILELISPSSSLIVSNIHHVDTKE